MSWDKAYLNCGVAKVDGSMVKIYKDLTSYISISPPGKPIDARWSGDGVLITLENGKLVKFSSLTSYQYF
ncbi:MAG: hypothetical protein FWH18_12035 [Marinilabiliaceae bacterium]|nr:hypothetical protein [Marinilabiliaceae bacterium]